MARELTTLDRFFPADVPAPLAGEASERDLAAEVLDRVITAREHWAWATRDEEEDEHEREIAAWDLLAAWGALQRLRPELGDAALAAETERLVRSEREALVDRALRSADPQRWLALAGDFCDDSLSGDFERAELARRSRELLSDLDDAELVAWAAARLGADPSDLEARLEPCLDLVAREPAPWMDAWGWMRALRRAADPAMDIDLLPTVTKLGPILHAAAAVWRDRAAYERRAAAEPRPLPEVGAGLGAPVPANDTLELPFPVLRSAAAAGTSAQRAPDPTVLEVSVKRVELDGLTVEIEFQQRPDDVLVVVRADAVAVTLGASRCELTEGEWAAPFPFEPAQVPLVVTLPDGATRQILIVPPRSMQGEPR